MDKEIENKILDKKEHEKIMKNISLKLRSDIAKQPLAIRRDILRLMIKFNETRDITYYYTMVQLIGWKIKHTKDGKTVINVDLRE